MPMTPAANSGSFPVTMTPNCQVVITNEADGSQQVIGMGGTQPVINPDGTLGGQTNPVLTGAGYNEGPSLVSVQIAYGYDMGTATATVELTADPNVSEWSLVQIYCGSNPGGPAYGANRFTGFFLEIQANLWPHTYSMVCKGNLYRAEQYRQSAFVDLMTQFGPFAQNFAQQVSQGIQLGQPLLNFGGPGGTPGIPQGYLNTTDFTQITDANIVLAILQEVDASNGPGSWAMGVDPDIAVVPDNIGGVDPGVGNLFYLLPMVVDLTWPPFRSAMEMIQPLDECCLGFRTFEDVGGKIVRKQIYGYPSQSQHPYDPFTEGVDLWDARGVRSVQQLINAAYIEGAPIATDVGFTGAVFALFAQDNPFMQAATPVVEEFRSSFIGTMDIIDPGSQSTHLLNANRVAEWKVAEKNRELVTWQGTTPRDDIFFIADTIGVNAAHTAVTEPIWIQRVEIRIQAQPVLFQQTVYGLGGGFPGNLGGPPPEDIQPGLPTPPGEVGTPPDQGGGTGDGTGDGAGDGSGDGGGTVPGIGPGQGPGF